MVTFPNRWHHLHSWPCGSGCFKLEVHSGTTLDSLQNLRTLKFDEWQAKALSAESAKVKEKLATRKVGAAQAGR